MLLEMVASNGRTLFKLFQVRVHRIFNIIMCLLFSWLVCLNLSDIAVPAVSVRSLFSSGLAHHALQNKLPDSFLRSTLKCQINIKLDSADAQIFLSLRI